MIDAIVIVALLFAGGAKDTLKLESCNQDMACSHDAVPRAKISKISASSTLSDSKGRYAVEMLLDGDESTAWCEGKKGSGAGESVVIELSEPTEIDRILITPMYAKSKQTVESNNRITKLTLELDGDRYALHVEKFLENECDKAGDCTAPIAPMQVALPAPRKVRRASVTVDAVERGKADDTCMSTFVLLAPEKE